MDQRDGAISPLDGNEQPYSNTVLTYAGDTIVLARPESLRGSYSPLPPPGDEISPDSHVLTLTTCFRAKMIGNLQDKENLNRSPGRRGSSPGAIGTSHQLPRSNTEIPWAPDSHVLQLTTSFRAKMTGTLQASPLLKGSGYLSPQLPTRKERHGRSLSANSTGRALSPTHDQVRSPEVFDRLFNLHKKKTRLDEQDIVKPKGAQDSKTQKISVKPRTTTSTSRETDEDKKKEEGRSPSRGGEKKEPEDGDNQKPGKKGKKGFLKVFSFRKGSSKGKRGSISSTPPKKSEKTDKTEKPEKTEKTDVKKTPTRTETDSGVFARLTRRSKTENDVKSEKGAERTGTPQRKQTKTSWGPGTKDTSKKSPFNRLANLVRSKKNTSSSALVSPISSPSTGGADIKHQPKDDISSDRKTPTGSGGSSSDVTTSTASPPKITRTPSKTEETQKTEDPVGSDFATDPEKKTLSPKKQADVHLPPSQSAVNYTKQKSTSSKSPVKRNGKDVVHYTQRRSSSNKNVSGERKEGGASVGQSASPSKQQPRRATSPLPNHRASLTKSASSGSPKGKTGKEDSSDSKGKSPRTSFFSRNSSKLEKSPEQQAKEEKNKKAREEKEKAKFNAKKEKEIAKEKAKTEAKAKADAKAKQKAEEKEKQAKEKQAKKEKIKKPNEKEKKVETKSDPKEVKEKESGGGPPKRGSIIKQGTNQIKEKVTKFKTIPRSTKEASKEKKTVSFADQEGEKNKEKVTTIKPVISTTTTVDKPTTVVPTPAPTLPPTPFVPSTTPANNPPPNLPDATIGGSRFSRAPKKILPRAQREALEKKAQLAAATNGAPPTTGEPNTIVTTEGGTSVAPATQTATPSTMGVTSS